MGWFLHYTMTQGLSKEEKLCSRKKIEQLFAAGSSFAQYPLRIVYRIHEKNNPEELPQFFVSIPKRKFKKAVKRVWLRRRVREAYRLNKQLLPDMESQSIDMAFLYTSNEAMDYHRIEHSMKEILNRLAHNIHKETE